MQIPKSFLRKIAKRRKKTKLLRLKSRVNGGITLIKNPEEISLYDVIVSMARNIALNRCVINKKFCRLSAHYPIHPVWFSVKEELSQLLKEITFSNLLTLCSPS